MDAAFDDRPVHGEDLREDVRLGQEPSQVGHGHELRKGPELVHVRSRRIGKEPLEARLVLGILRALIGGVRHCEFFHGSMASLVPGSAGRSPRRTACIAMRPRDVIASHRRILQMPLAPGPRTSAATSCATRAPIRPRSRPVFAAGIPRIARAAWPALVRARGDPPPTSTPCARIPPASCATNSSSPAWLMTSTPWREGGVAPASVSVGTPIQSACRGRRAAGVGKCVEADVYPMMERQVGASVPYTGVKAEARTCDALARKTGDEGVVLAFGRHAGDEHPRVR